jgi:uncharacterized beta barrel domain-containing protein DUF5777
MMPARAANPMRTRVLRALPGLLSLALAATTAAAQEPQGPYEPVRRDPIGTRLIDMATPYPVEERQIELLLTLRFRLPVQQGSGHDLWGLDSGADTGFGLAVGVAPGFDLSLYRSLSLEDYELAGKFLVFEQAPRLPLTVAVRAGADLVERPGVPNGTRPFAQLLLARRLLPGCNLLLAPSWVRYTPRLANAWNVPLGLTFALPGHALLELEYVSANRDLPASQPAWHVALSKALGRNLLQLVAGNSRATTVDQILGSDFDFARRDVRLGFNMVSNFDF